MLLIVPVAVLKLPRTCAHAVAVAAADVVEVLEEPAVEDELLPQPASRNSIRRRNKQPASIFPGELLSHIRSTFIRTILSRIAYSFAALSEDRHQDLPYIHPTGIRKRYFLAAHTGYSVAKLI